MPRGPARRSPPQRATPRTSARAAGGWEAFAHGPVAAFVLEDGVVVAASDALSRALGLADADVVGREIAELLPAVDGHLPTPRPGAVRGYHTRVAGVPARVDLAAAPEGDPSAAVAGVLTLHPEQADTAAETALLALSRALAEAREEEGVTAAAARALELLFPGRTFSIRLVDPATLALTSFYARGRLRAKATRRLGITADAARRAGLHPDELRAAGVLLAREDEPLFEGSTAALSEPLAVSGELFGVLSLEYDGRTPGTPEADGPLLRQVAGHVALGARNLRSLAEANRARNDLTNLVEHANALICAVDRDRRVTVWNAALAKLTGRAQSSAIGSDVLLAFVPDDRARAREVLDRGLAGASDALELRLLRASGGEARVALNVAPRRAADGEVDGVIAAGQDLTLLRSLQDAAEHAERLAAIGRLVAGVVHELNNPLTAVTMYSDVLVEKAVAKGQDPADVEKLRAIKEAGLRIQRLARDLVTYARPTGARTEPVDLAGVVDEALRMAKPALKDSSAVMTREGAGAPVVDANRASLVQVVLALVTNAAQAIAPGGRITVGLGAEQGEAVLRVRDEGCGMSPEVLARAFEPFFTTRAGVGIGLGLPIVRGIVERHGGTVRLESAPAKGTTVTVRLPVKPAPAP